MRFSGRPRDVKSPGIQPAKAIPVAGWLERLLGLLRLRVRYRISGSSMLPILREDDEIFVAPRAVVRRGDIVVARHPYRLDWVYNHHGCRAEILLVEAAVGGYDEGGGLRR